MGIAGVHVGRKARGWRAILNVRRSWLSREIVVLSMFVTIASTWLALAPATSVMGWAAALVGFAGLVCADNVYGVLANGPGYRHSAGVTATGALLAGAMTGATIVALPVLALKVWMFEHEARRLSPIPAGARVVVGFVAPVVLWPLDRTHAASVACILLGEAIGRCEVPHATATAHTPRRDGCGAGAPEPRS